MVIRTHHVTIRAIHLVNMNTWLLVDQFRHICYKVDLCVAFAHIMELLALRCMVPSILRLLHQKMYIFTLPLDRNTFLKRWQAFGFNKYLVTCFIDVAVHLDCLQILIKRLLITRYLAISPCKTCKRKVISE